MYRFLLLFALCSSPALADTYNFYFDPGDVPISFSIPTNLATATPYFSDGHVSLYALDPVTNGPLTLGPMFEADFLNGQLIQTAIRVSMTWTGPQPAPFDIVFDNAGEHQSFAKSIFNLDANGNLVSFNPGIYGDPFHNLGLQITLDPTPEPATVMLLLLGFLALAAYSLIR